WIEHGHYNAPLIQFSSSIGNPQETPEVTRDACLRPWFEVVDQLTHSPFLLQFESRRAVPGPK
ncbi:unnamed protein product, partial [Brassica rapa subsp. trilocularis]